MEFVSVANSKKSNDKIVLQDYDVVVDEDTEIKSNLTPSAGLSVSKEVDIGIH